MVDHLIVKDGLSRGQRNAEAAVIRVEEAGRMIRVRVAVPDGDIIVDVGVGFADVQIRAVQQIIQHQDVYTESKADVAGAACRFRVAEDSRGAFNAHVPAEGHINAAAILSAGISRDRTSVHHQDAVLRQIDPATPFGGLIAADRPAGNRQQTGIEDSAAVPAVAASGNHAAAPTVGDRQRTVVGNDVTVLLRGAG